MANFPNSFTDPLYSALAAAAEQKFNLPTGILNAIRMRGERSNADQVSSAGARTPYQFIQSTRQGMENNYGIDPWSSPQAATDAAAQLLAENHNRGGSWNKAIAMYYGGNHPGPSAQRYQARVGDFDQPDVTKPYYTGANDMPSTLYPVVNGVDPLAPEPPTTPVPVPGSPSPSVSASPTSPVANHKRGGILGALESVFMPDPNSLWAGALRDGVFNAKESQRNYQMGQAQQALNLAVANQKLKDLMTKGEYQVVGNNVFHIRPDGSTEMISGPSSTDDKQKLISVWNARRQADPNDPTLPLYEAPITGGDNTAQAQAAKRATAESVARIRAGATTEAARIRGVNSPSTANILPPLPPGAKVIH